MNSEKDIRRNFYTFRLFLGALVFSLMVASNASAVPETVGTRITDVTTTSFSMVWMTDVAALPEIEVYSDSGMSTMITEQTTISALPAGSLAEEARSKGIMKVRVTGLLPSTKYYVRSVTRDPGNLLSVGYSAVYEVVTASEVRPYHGRNGKSEEFSNDLIAFSVYIRPSDPASFPGLGDLIILESEESPYPISAFAGKDIISPEGILDMNNLFDLSGVSADFTGDEKIVINIYRGGTLSTLLHYRKVPTDNNLVSVEEPVKGFFADVNLDGSVDEVDFESFKNQYRALPDDAHYNPDFDFVEDNENSVDVREFSKFSREYGRTDVQ